MKIIKHDLPQFETLEIYPLWGAVGAVTSKKHYGFAKCLKCGHQWKV